jgi:threonine synthase
MRGFRQTGRLGEDEQAWRMACRLFSAHKVGDTETMQTITETYARTGSLIDPHTAIAVASAQADIAAHGRDAPMVALACAHPAKFPEAVERATGIRPALPPALGDLLERRERVTVLPNELGAVAQFIRGHARRAGAAA